MNLTVEVVPITEDRESLKEFKKYIRYMQEFWD